MATDLTTLSGRGIIQQAREFFFGGQVAGASLDVFVQEEVSQLIDLYFNQLIGSTSLATGTAIDDTNIIITATADFNVGNVIGLFSETESGVLDRFYFGEILTITSNTLGMDTPLDFAFIPGDPIFSASRELDVDGSSTTQIFKVSVPALNEDLQLDIARLSLVMTHSAAGDDSKFGSLSALTNGIVIRSTSNGGTTVRNAWNAKTNGDLAVLSGNKLTYESRAGGGEFSTRTTYAITGEHGVAVRLASGDSIEILIQDDLSSLSSLRLVAAGHVVPN